MLEVPEGVKKDDAVSIKHSLTAQKPSPMGKKTEVEKAHGIKNIMFLQITKNVGPHFQTPLLQKLALRGKLETILFCLHVLTACFVFLDS